MLVLDCFIILIWLVCLVMGRLWCNIFMLFVCVIVMVICDLVMVFIVELISGILSLIFLVSWLEVFVVVGIMLEVVGNNKMLLNVSFSIVILCGLLLLVGIGLVVRLFM